MNVTSAHSVQSENILHGAYFKIFSKTGFVCLIRFYIVPTQYQSYGNVAAKNVEELHQVPFRALF
jgi:hypothetical protein